ncbi:hypothetical protein BDV12DRAFT_207576 [Aspergillus spectabilis]
MSSEEGSFGQDSVANTRIIMDSDRQGSAVDNSHEKDKAQGDDVEMSSEGHKIPECELSSNDKDDFLSSRIPRGISLRQTANFSAVKGTRLAAEPRSSIPIAIRSRSAEQLGTILQEKQTESSSGGIRLVVKPRGPRPRPSVEPAAPIDASPGQGVEEIPEAALISSSSSSVGSWDFSDADEPERPATVFTGEYRTRVLAIAGQQTPGPILRIASSAENIIMGGAAQEPSGSVATQKTSPSMIKYLSKLSPSTPKDTKIPRGTTPGSKTSAGSSQDGTSVTRNFCRPQVSLDSIPRRDISGKEMSISRKPVSRPSLSSLFSPSSKSLHTEDEPLVPRIPDQYFPSCENAMSPVSRKADEPATPAKVLSEIEGTSLIPGSNMMPTPETAIKCSTMYPHPPRASSLQALSDYSGEPHSQQDAAIKSGKPSKKVANMRRNVTFNDFVPLTPGTEQSIQTPNRARLPESRSNLLLGGFRSIFKSRSDGNTPATLNENEPPNIHTDCEKSSRFKPKHTRLPSGVSWTKSSRNPKNATESPATPTPSLPRLLAPPKRSPDANIPSFARPTKSTRTKAGVKGQVLTTPDAHPRRIHRLSRTSKRTPGNILMLATQKRANQSPVSVSAKKTTPSNVSAECVPKNLDAFRSCLDTLCKRIGEATTPLERDRHIRFALSLQQQLGDYQNIEKMALEAEALAKEKRLERKVAEESLNTSLAEVQAQLEED